MGNIRFGILGYGGSGQPTSRRLTEFIDVEVVAIFDPKKVNRGEREPSYLAETNFYRDLDAFFSCGLDAVAICTPDHTHIDYIRCAAEKGVSVLVEKPMVVSLKEAKEVKDILDTNKINFGVHHQKRYIPSFREAFKKVRSGAIGEIVHIEVDYIHDMRERAFIYDDWRVNIHNPQEVALGFSSHSFDLVRWISGKEVQTIFSMETGNSWPEYPTNDTNISLLELEDNTTAKVTSIISSGGPQIERVIIYGTQGQIRNNIIHRIGQRPKYTCAVNSKIRRSDMLVSKILQYVNICEFPFTVNEHDKACRALLRDFVDTIKNDKKFWIGQKEGAEAVKICVASMLSAREKIPIDMSKIEMLSD